MMHHSKVTVIGAGYVGLTTSLALSYIGHRVCCFDVDREKIAALRNGCAPIHEPFTPEMLAITAGRLTFSDDPIEAIDGASIIFLAVNTPSGPDGRANLQYVKSAAESIGRHLS